MWKEVPIISIFESLEELVECSKQFIARKCVDSFGGLELALAIEAEPFASLAVGTVFGLLEYSVSLSVVGSRASRIFASKFFLDVVRNFRSIPRSIVLEVLFTFSLRKSCVDFCCLVWSDLIRSGTIPFSRLAHLLTVSSVAPRAGFDIVSRVSCPSDARAERPLGDSLCNPLLDLTDRLVRFLNDDQHLVSADVVLAGAAEFDIDASLVSILEVVERECCDPANVVSVAALSARMSRQHRLIDVLLLLPRCDMLLAQMAEWLGQCRDEVSGALLVSLMSRVWLFDGVCTDSKSALLSKFQRHKEDSVDLPILVSYSEEASAVDLVRNGGCIPASHALCSLLLAMRPGCLDKLMQVLANEENRFDSLLFFGPQDVWFRKEHAVKHYHYAVWKAIQLGPDLDLAVALPFASDVLKRPCDFALWQINHLQVPVDVAKQLWSELAEKIGRSRHAQQPDIRLWLALLVCMKRLGNSAGVHSKVCLLTLPAALSSCYRGILSRSEHASIIALVLGSVEQEDFEHCLNEMRDEGPDERCMILLEPLLPLNLAALLKQKINALAVEGESPFIDDGSKTKSVLIREPQNLVKGWTVHAKPYQTILSRVMEAGK